MPHPPSPLWSWTTKRKCTKEYTTRWVRGLTSFTLCHQLTCVAQSNYHCPPPKKGVRDGDRRGGGYSDEQWRLLCNSVHQVHHFLSQSDWLAVQRGQNGKLASWDKPQLNLLKLEDNVKINKLALLRVYRVICGFDIKKNITCKHSIRVCFKGIWLFIPDCLSVITHWKSIQTCWQHVDICKSMSPKQTKGTMNGRLVQWLYP